MSAKINSTVTMIYLYTIDLFDNNITQINKPKRSKVLYK